MKILAVDDDKISLSLLKEALSACGFTDVTFCLSAAIALEHLMDADVPYECLLYDIQMPGMNGIDLCKETRAMKDYRRTPIVMVTAMSEKRYVDQAFDAGATDYITKPFDPLEVGVRVKLAGDLNEEHKCVQQSNGVIELLVKELDKVTTHKLDVPIELANAQRVLSYPAFENYLFEQGRGVFVLSCLFAVKVKGVEKIHANIPPLEFKQILVQTARVIVRQLGEFDIFLSYRGNGVFVGVAPREAVTTLKKIGREISFDMSALDADLPPEIPSETTLVFGDPVVPKMFTRLGTLKNLRLAIANAEQDRARPKPKRQPLIILTGRKTETDDMRALRREEEIRAGYEKLMKETLETNLVTRFPNLVEEDTSSAKKDSRRPA